jgi:hypothetical protein
MIKKSSLIKKKSPHQTRKPGQLRLQPAKLVNRSMDFINFNNINFP